jgi:hypothetical protein
VGKTENSIGWWMYIVIKRMPIDIAILRAINISTRADGRGISNTLRIRTRLNAITASFDRRSDFRGTMIELGLEVDVVAILFQKFL